MRSTVVILSCVLVVGLLLVGVSEYRKFTQRDKISVRPDEEQSEIPLPSKKGPHPKATILNGTEYDFGLMEQGQESSHVFRIRNEGQAPLKLLANHKGDNTCECTVGKLDKTVVEPGDTAEVKVQWGVKKSVVNFAHSATIRTNDPDQMKIPFIIKGLIGQRAVIKPSTNWTVGHLTENKPVKVELTLHSETVANFQLLKVESSSGLVTTKARPLTPDELAQLGSRKRSDAEKKKPLKAKSATPQAKTGYAITATLSANMPAGPFTETLTFYTDMSENHSINFHLSGSRAGRIEFMQTRGAEWNSKRLLLKLGTFSAAKGKTVRVPLILKDIPTEAKITVKETSPQFLKVSLEQDENFPAKKNRRYWLTLNVPAKTPPLTLTARSLGKVTLETGEKENGAISFFVGFVSF